MRTRQCSRCRLQAVQSYNSICLSGRKTSKKYIHVDIYIMELPSSNTPERTIPVKLYRLAAWNCSCWMPELLKFIHQIKLIINLLNISIWQYPTLYCNWIFTLAALERLWRSDEGGGDNTRSLILSSSCGGGEDASLCNKHTHCNTMQKYKIC